MCYSIQIQIFHQLNTPNFKRFSISLLIVRNRNFDEKLTSNRFSKSISKSSCILGELAKKRKKKTTNSYPIEILSTSSSILVFYPEDAAGYLCLALSASHPFLDFGEAVGFHLIFASYFVLHNSYIRILTIHR